jgi:HTH-type transcriptional regulator, sugar sensing transcriptional regulator
MQEELKHYGLSEKEIKIYLSNLKLGTTTANQIAIDSGVKRTTTYEVIESLKQKGIVSTFKKDKKSFFEATDPKRLISILKEKEKLIENILPELEKMQKSTSEKPTVQLFIGKEGIKTIFEEILEHKMDYWISGNTDIFEKLGYYFPNFIQRRIKAGIHARVIETRSGLTKEHKRTAKKDNRKIKFLDFKLKSQIVIYENNAAFITISDEELVGIKITNKFIIETQKQLFEILWKVASNN